MGDLFRFCASFFPLFFNFLRGGGLFWFSVLAISDFGCLDAVNRSGSERCGGGVVRVYVVLHGCQNVLFAVRKERRAEANATFVRLLGFPSHSCGFGEKCSRLRDDVLHDQRGCDALTHRGVVSRPAPSACQSPCDGGCG